MMRNACQLTEWRENGWNVHQNEQQGIHDVYVGHILARGDFSKCPGLTKECFEKQRKKVNKLLEQRFKEKFVKF